MKCNNFDKKPVRTGSDTPWKENNMKIAIVTWTATAALPRHRQVNWESSCLMPFMINGETFEEDINLTQEEFYKRQAEDADISTSQPSPQDVTGSLGQTACGRLRSDRAYPDVQRLKRLLSDGPHAGR